MGITGALYSGVSGLKANGNAMSVIGNNLSNSNTIGYKASNTIFSDLLPNTVASSGGGSQIGRGTQLSTVRQSFTQGTFKNTESETDLAIEGPGFFITRPENSDGRAYTRNGAFQFSDAGFMETAEGQRVQGYKVNEQTGEVGNKLDDIKVDTRSRSEPQATKTVDLVTNLNSNATILDSTARIQKEANTISEASAGTSANIATEIYSGSGDIEDLVINGQNIKVGDYSDGDFNKGSAKEIIEDINGNNSLDNIKASANINELNLGTLNINNSGTFIHTDNNDGYSTSGDGDDLVINGVDIAKGAENAASGYAEVNNAQDLVNLINSKCGDTNVEASLNGENELVLRSTDGSNIQLQTAGGVRGADPNSGSYEDIFENYSDFTVGASGAVDSLIQYGGITLESNEDISIEADTASDNGSANVLEGVQLKTRTEGTNGVVEAEGFDLENPGQTSNFASSISMYDSKGDTHVVTTYFRKTNDNQWEYNVTVPCEDLDCTNKSAGIFSVKKGTIQFDENGEMVSPESGEKITTDTMNWSNGANPSTLDLSLNITQYASDSEVVSQNQDGFATGTLVQLSVDDEGYVLGNYSNGEPRKLYQLALASFPNDQGLEQRGSSMYMETEDSGAPNIGTVGSGVGSIFTNSLEQSNVDIAQQFTDMITTQRGYQANSRVITTTDEMLNEVINMKR